MELQYIAITNVPMNKLIIYFFHFRSLLLKRRMEEYSCGHCAKTFHKKEYLKNHVNYVHSKKYSNKNATCNLCNKTMKNNSLQLHNAMVHLNLRKKDHQCESCEKSFYAKNDLTKHFMRIHQKVKTQCITCKEFVSYGTLKRHQDAIHLKLQNFKCNKCNKEFSSKRYFIRHNKTKRHMQVDEQEQEQVYGNENELLKESNKSKYEKHKCELCDKKFATNWKLQRHITGLHKKSKIFDCNWCEMKYAWKQSLDNHIRLVHRNRRTIENVQRPNHDQDEVQKQGIKIMLENSDGEMIGHEQISTNTNNDLPLKNKGLQCMICNEILKTHSEFFEHVENSHKIV